MVSAQLEMPPEWSGHRVALVTRDARTLEISARFFLDEGGQRAHLAVPAPRPNPQLWASAFAPRPPPPAVGPPPPLSASADNLSCFMSCARPLGPNRKSLCQHGGRSLRVWDAIRSREASYFFTADAGGFYSHHINWPRLVR